VQQVIVNVLVSLCFVIAVEKQMSLSCFFMICHGFVLGRNHEGFLLFTDL